MVLRVLPRKLPSWAASALAGGRNLQAQQQQVHRRRHLRADRSCLRQQYLAAYSALKPLSYRR
jgi:hypothetical protein